MRKAKENVEKHYAVVGVLEEFNKTLTVLEHYVPRFFKGAKDVYWSKKWQITFISLTNTLQIRSRNIPKLIEISTNQPQQKQQRIL